MINKGTSVATAKRLVSCALLTTTLFTAACSKDRSDDYVESRRKALVLAANEWKEYVQEKVTNDTTVEDLDRTMKGKYLERAHIPLSGGGEFEVIYRLDDYLALLFFFDGDGKMGEARLQDFDQGLIRSPNGGLIWWDHRTLLRWILKFNNH